MIRNPFVISGKIPADLFCDRVAEALSLTRRLQNQEHVVLLSPRRVGKTGLMDFCFAKPELSDNYYIINIDILHTTSLREFMFELGHAVFRQVASRSERMLKSFTQIVRSLSASFGYDAIQASPTLDLKLGDITNPDYSWDEICQFLEHAERPCIVAIDEFQQIVNYPEKNVEALLRSHIQRLSNACFIFAGSERRIMDEMFHSSARPFYNSTTTLLLEPIALDVYAEFVTHHFHEAAMLVDRAAIDYVYTTFEGVTFYVQRIFHDAFATMQSGDTCTQELAAKLIEDYTDSCDTRLREQLSYITEQQKELLYAISNAGVAERITSSAFVKRHKLKSASAVQSAEKKLLEYDLITKHERTYTIADPLLRLWLKRKGH